MFYSHEILSNSKYGVATIWLAATVGKGVAAGKGALRRLTRKAVQDVNVPKACETIIDPGAPLALRLQGSLLYGVSRVFAQQTGYVLSDAEKTQSDMRTFFRILHTSETDPQAGKTKRHLITLQDDPGFDLLGAFPSLGLLRGDKEVAGIPSQGSTNKFSQMTPRGAPSQGSLSSNPGQALLPFDLPSSSLCAGSHRLPSDFGRYSSPFAKHNRESEAMPEFRPFGDDELDPINVIGLDFDADGNLVGIHEPEPELPPLTGTAASQAQHSYGSSNVFGEAENQLTLGGSGMGEAALPDASAFPLRAATKLSTESFAIATETTETEGASAGNQRCRRRKANSMIDQIDRISRNEFRSWSDNYVQNMDAGRKRLKTTTQTQARKNALALMYGNRIADIGIASANLGVFHPLAEDFAGRALKAHLQGLRPDEVDFGVKETRGRRRKSPEAFAQEQAGQDEERNVRQRLDQDPELGRGGDGREQDDLVFGDESAPELGMDAPPPMDDQHSSSVMPWSRPASAVRGQGSAPKVVPSPSPLHGRGNVLGPLERHSDPVETPLGGAIGPDFQDSSGDFGDSIGALDFHRGDDAPASSAGFNAASQEFLGYVTEQAGARGIARDTEGQEDRRWVSFAELASPETHSKAVAAEAFFHVLCLASRGAIAVEQDGAAHYEPFGVIRIGVDVPRRRAESDDELA